MDFSIQRIQGEVIHYGVSIFAAGFILIAGYWTAKMSTKMVEGVMIKAKINRTLVTFVRHLAFYGMMTFAVIAALNKLGVETTSFIAVIGAASFAVGLALQGALGNFASGVLLILFHPFKVGDTIEAAGTKGLVDEIQIFNTIIITTERHRVIVPNAKITGDKVTVLASS